MNTEILDTNEENGSELLTQVQSISMPDLLIEGRRSSAALRMACAFKVTCHEDFEMAGEELRSIIAKRKALEVKHQSVARPLYTAWKAFNAMFKPHIDALEQAEKAIKTVMIQYTDEQERIAAEARRVVEVAANIERKRLEDEARAIEALALAERQRVALIESTRVAQAQAEQDRLAEIAIVAMRAGDAAAAEEAEKQSTLAFERESLAVMQSRKEAEEADSYAANEVASLQLEASVISAPVFELARVKTIGISQSKTVDFEVASLLELVKHIAVNPELINLLSYDSTKLRAYVRGLGMNTKLPGVRVFEKRSISSRAA